MKKTGKKLFAAALAAMMAIASIAPATTFADGEYKLHFDANGGTFEGGAATADIPLGTASASKSSHSENYSDSGERSGTIHAAISGEYAGTSELVASTVVKDDRTYYLTDATITGSIDTMPYYAVDILDEYGQSLLDGQDPTNFTINTTGAAVLSISITNADEEGQMEGGEPQEPVEVNGHFVSATANYMSVDYSIDNPGREGYNFTGWFLDQDATVPFTGISTEGLPGSIPDAVYAGWEKLPVSENFSVRVVDADDGAGIAGVTVSAMLGEGGEQLVTDENGVVTFADKGEGTYYITQVAAPEAYEPKTGIGSVAVTDEGVYSEDIPMQDGAFTYSLTKKVEPVSASFSIRVVDEETEAAIPGVTVAATLGEDAEQLVTDENGLVTFNNKGEGTYLITELSAPETYEPKTDIGSITVSKDGVYSEDIASKDGVFTYSLKKKSTPVPVVNDFTIRVIDEDTDAGIANVTIAAALGEDVQKVVTDKNGLAVFVSKGEGTYRISQIAAPDTYEPKTDIGTVIVTKDNIYSEDIAKVDNAFTYSLKKKSGPTPTTPPTPTDPPTPTEEPTPAPVVETGQLTLRNVVSGNGADLNKKFKFTITIKDTAGSGVNATYDCTGVSGGKITFKSGDATVKLANAEEITISGIPKGYQVSIVQAEAEGYTTSPATRQASGTMTTGRLTATFKNIKVDPTATPEPTATVTPTITSTANLTFNAVTISDDAADKEKKFTYTLTIMNGSTPLTGSYSYSGTGTGTVAFSSEGKISFQMKDSQTLTINGLPTGTTYTIAKGDEGDGFALTKSREDGIIDGNISVTLTETKNGVTPTAAPGTTDSSTTSATTSPSAATLNNVGTGDQRPIAIFVVIAAAALVVVFIALKKGGKSDNKAE